MIILDTPLATLNILQLTLTLTPFIYPMQASEQAVYYLRPLI